MSIKDWPATERQREKLLTQGASSLTDAELLAIFLRTGVIGESAVDLARQLLSEFGTLRALLEADLDYFSSHLGLGTAKYVQLQAVIEMSKRHLVAKLQKGTALQNSQLVKDFLITQLRSEPHEVFGCIFLDSKHRVINYENLFYGTINQSTVYPRQVLKRCLYFNTAAVIFAHNHQSGNNEPSESDKMLTKQLVDALSYIDVKVLDHLIIGDDEPFSMAEWGMF